jgi:hypothetical protein
LINFLNKSISYLNKYIKDDNAIEDIYNDYSKDLSLDPSFVKLCNKYKIPVSSPHPRCLTIVKSLGSLEVKPEPAGKMRVFAMVDCITQ